MQLQFGFDLWPGNFHMPWVQGKKNGLDSQGLGPSCLGYGSAFFIFFQKAVSLSQHRSCLPAFLPVCCRSWAWRVFLVSPHPPALIRAQILASAPWHCLHSSLGSSGREWPEEMANDSVLRQWVSWTSKESKGEWFPRTPKATLEDDV